MKKTVFWVFLHLIIPVGFIWATGMLEIIIHSASHGNNDKNSAYHNFSSVDYDGLEINLHNVKTYSDSLYSVRKKQIEVSGAYLPDDYFHDLKQYKMFASYYGDSLNNSTEDRIVYMNYCTPGGILNKFFNLRSNTWSNYSKEDNDKARCKWFPTEIANEKRIEKEVQESNFVYDIAIAVSGWFVKFWLRGLPFAFLMLIFWRLNLKKDYEESSWSGDNKNREKIFSSRFTPISFLLSLLIWPLVVYIDIRNRMNSLLVKTEVLSRRESLISLFSKKELELLRIGQKMSRKEFNSYLDNLGYIRKHSFAKTLMLIVFLEITIPQAYAIGSLIETAHKHRYSLVIDHTDRFDCDIGVSILSPPQPIIKKFVEVKEKIIFNLRASIGRILSGFVQKLLSVPKFEVLFI